MSNDEAHTVIIPTSARQCPWHADILASHARQEAWIRGIEETLTGLKDMPSRLARMETKLDDIGTRLNADDDAIRDLVVRNGQRAVDIAKLDAKVAGIAAVVSIIVTLMLRLLKLL